MEIAIYLSVGPYTKSTIQQQPGGTIIQKYVSLNWVTVIGTDTVWFRIFEVLQFYLERVAKGNT